MKKKTTIKIIAIVIAVLIVVTGGIAAYLTDTDTVTNTFTVGKVKIAISEENWNPENGEGISPGDVIAKDPAIQNIGKNSAYVYMKIEQPIVSLTNGGSGPLFSYTKNSGWILLDTYECENTSTKTSIYYYNTDLAKNTTTTKLFNNVTIAEYDQDLTADEQDLVVTGYAIQSNNLPSGMTKPLAYNINFADSSCVKSDIIYRFSSTNWNDNQNISSLTLGTDYVKDKSQLTNMNPLASQYYLKYKVLNNTIDNKYICFVVTPAMKQANPEMTVGEYCIQGGDTNSYNDNKAMLNIAFGSSNCSESPSYVYTCTKSSYTAEVETYGEAYFTPSSGHSATITSSGNSYCS